jgi:phosphohistidine phosphatase
VLTLQLLRHAKSSWADPALLDRDRPLAPRGTRAARQVAAYLRSEATHPDLVLCSPARRARETLEVLLATVGATLDVRVEDDLYGAYASDLLQRLREVATGVESVLVVGHNPGLQDLAIELAGDGEEDAMQQLRAKFPTAAVATLDAGVAQWADLAPGCAYLTRVVVPRSLPEA